MAAVQSATCGQIASHNTQPSCRTISSPPASAMVPYVGGRTGRHGLPAPALGNRRHSTAASVNRSRLSHSGTGTCGPFSFATAVLPRIRIGLPLQVTLESTRRAFEKPRRFLNGAIQAERGFSSSLTVISVGGFSPVCRRLGFSPSLSRIGVARMRVTFGHGLQPGDHQFCD